MPLRDSKDSNVPAENPVLAPADGYAAMFQDAPPPTADDLRGLSCVEVRLTAAERPAAWPRRPAEAHTDSDSPCC
jgi:hypothetical protein